MVTPEDEGEPLQLDRRSVTAAALRSGSIRISEPIPLDNAAPSALPAVRSPVRPSTSGPATGMPSQGQQRRVDMALQNVSSPALHQELSERVVAEGSRPRRVRTPELQTANRESVITSSGSPGSNGGKRSPPSGGRKRRSSGLGTVIKRLFSKRGRSVPRRRSPPRSRQTPQQGSHRSDTVVRPLGVVTESRAASSARESSVPKDDDRLPSERTPVRMAPRLPFPMNIHAPRHSPPQLAGPLNSSPVSLRRRATLPSMVVSLDDPDDLRHYPYRPEAEVPLRQDDDYAQFGAGTIGLAISPGMNSNRRSRSVGALAAAARMADEEERARRRSAELEYLKLGYGDVAMGFADDDLTDDESDNDSVGSRTSTPGGDVFFTKARGLRRGLDVPSGELPSDLAASGLGHDFVKPGAVPMSALDNRLSQLEENMLNLTTSLSALTTRAQRQTYVLEGAPRRRSRSSSPRTASPPGQQAPSMRSSRLGPTASQKGKGPLRQSIPETRSPGLPALSSTARRTSTEKRRSLGGGQPASPYRESQQGPSRSLWPEDPSSLSPQSINLSPTSDKLPAVGSRTSYRDSIISNAPPMPVPEQGSPNLVTTASIYTHLAPIYSALRYERIQRKDLEGQVEILTKQLNEMADLMRTMQMRQMAGYPTPATEFGSAGAGQRGSGQSSRGPPRVQQAQPQSRWSGHSSRTRSSRPTSYDVETGEPSSSTARPRDSAERPSTAYEADLRTADLGREYGDVMQAIISDTERSEFGSPRERWSTPMATPILEAAAWLHAGNLRDSSSTREQYREGDGRYRQPGP